MNGAFQTIVYQSQTGREPFSDWLDSLDRSVKGKVIARIDRLADGNFGNAKALKDGLFELKFRNPAFRIYYSLIGTQLILLLSGGDKSRQSDDIEKAKNYLTDYRRRYGNKKK